VTAPHTEILDETQATLMAQRLLWAERDVNRAEQHVRDAEQAMVKAQQSQNAAERERLAEIGRTDELRAQLAQLYASTSWKFARPVRAFNKLQHSIQKLLGRATAPAAAKPLPPPPRPETSLPLQGREQAMLNRLRGHL
jgi:hypothetical protein